MSNIEANIQKIFWYSLTQRRNYITILSLYFLTLPNTTANMIGLYTGIGNLVAFFLEVPSGYFADRFGHKKTLVLAKVFLVFSTASFIFIQNFYGFILGFICFTTALACTSGTKSAFIHETLTQLKREKEYSQVMGKLGGKVSLISMFFIIGFPFLVQISYLVPLYITLILDIIGIIIAVSLVEPNIHKKIKSLEIKSVKNIFKETKQSNLLPLLLFSSISMGLLIAESNFRYLYLEKLGYPVIYVGFVMGLSRGLWYVFSRYIHLFERYVNFKQHLLLEIILFPGIVILAAYLNQPYIIAGIIIVMLAYLWGRRPIIEGYILNNYNIDKNYKATILSFQGQITLFFQFAGAFGLGYIMNISYKLGYYTLGIAMLIGMLISFTFIVKNNNGRSNKKPLKIL